MANNAHRESFSGPLICGTALDPSETDLTWPFGDLDSLDRDDIRETAYEVFFTSCRSSPGFGGGRNAITFYSNHNNHHNHHDGTEGGSGGTGSPSGGRVGSGPVVVMSPTSRIKRALGLKMLKKSPSRRMSCVGTSGERGGGSGGSAPGSPVALPNHSGGASPAIGFSTVPLPSRPRRPLTSAEIMRLQMRVTEQSDNRLRKTLMRTLVGQVRVVMYKKVQTIIH